MQSTKKPAAKEQEPEVLDATTLTAIDKSDRWEPGNPGIPFDEALKHARILTKQSTAQLDQTA